MSRQAASLSDIDSQQGAQMDQEVAAQQAAQRWRASKDARDDLRVIILELLKTKNMTEISRITGIKRTTLYYFIWGRSGKQAA